MFFRKKSEDPEPDSESSSSNEDDDYAHYNYYDDYEDKLFGYLRAPRVPSPAPDMRFKKKVSIVGSGNW